eukprot:SM000128S26248  [mRNA]  locus=s128:334411:342290:+ [translate_table: standard]
MTTLPNCDSSGIECGATLIFKITLQEVKPPKGASASTIEENQTRLNMHAHRSDKARGSGGSPAASGGPQRSGAAYRDAILRGMVMPDDVAWGFHDFPYYLSDTTKVALLDACYVQLLQPEFAKYTADLATVSSRILLSGPPGSETYQEALVRALAKELRVRVLVFDLATACLEVNDGPRARRSAASTVAAPLSDGAPPPRLPSSAARMSAPGAEEAGASTAAVGSKVLVAEPEAGPRTSGEPLLPEAVTAAAAAAAAAGSPTAGLPRCPPQRPSVAAAQPPLSSGHVGGDGAVASEPDTPLADRSCRLGPPVAAAAFAALPDAASTSSTSATSAVADAAGSSSGSVGSRRILKKGDRVKYVGASSSAGLAVLNQGSPPGVYFMSASSGRLVDPATRGPSIGLKGRVLMVLEDNPHKVGVRFDKPVYGGNNLVDLCEDGHGFFCNVNELRQEPSYGEDVERLIVDSLLEVLAAEAAKEPLLVLIKHAERAIAGNFERYMKLDRLERREAAMPLVIIGSHTTEARKEKATGSSVGTSKVGNSSLNAILELSLLDQLSDKIGDLKLDVPKSSKMLMKLFPTKIVIQPPQDDKLLQEWNRSLDEDTEMLKAETNRQRIQAVLNVANMECEGLSDIHICNQVLPHEVVEKIVGWGASHHLQNNPPIVHDGRLVLDSASIQHSVGILQAIKQGAVGQTKTLKDIVTDNEFEKLLLQEVIPPDELCVTFEHIGALETVKETLKELVMLPLQRPELFVKGQLTKPVRGLLLFGPPGTGKTMLAKAVATEAGANFINVSMSTIASKWFGEAEKYVKAVFTLASKIAPSVIFIDEVDSMLARRGKDNEHSAMRKIKNEFMSAWDGLRTRQSERVLVLAATNRPYDLDEAVIRRFPRRLMVDLPDSENRAKILNVILADEDLSPDFSIEELATSTDGYSGSDLKNLCTTAAYRRIREILDMEKKEKELAKVNGVDLPSPSSTSAPFIRPLDMEDMKQAMEKVRSSVSQDASSMLELQQWNEQYGEGGSRRNLSPLTYFL